MIEVISIVFVSVVFAGLFIKIIHLIGYMACLSDNMRRIDEDIAGDASNFTRELSEVRSLRELINEEQAPYLRDYLTQDMSEESDD